jgi:hypothetical protein
MSSIEIFLEIMWAEVQTNEFLFFNQFFNFKFQWRQLQCQILNVLFIFCDSLKKWYLLIQNKSNINTKSISRRIVFSVRVQLLLKFDAFIKHSHQIFTLSSIYLDSRLMIHRYFIIPNIKRPILLVCKLLLEQ